MEVHLTTCAHLYSLLSGRLKWKHFFLSLSKLQSWPPILIVCANTQPQCGLKAIQHQLFLTRSQWVTRYPPAPLWALISEHLRIRPPCSRSHQEAVAQWVFVVCFSEPEIRTEPLSETEGWWEGQAKGVGGTALWRVERWVYESLVGSDAAAGWSLRNGQLVKFLNGTVKLYVLHKLWDQKRKNVREASVKNVFGQASLNDTKTTLQTKH